MPPVRVVGWSPSRPRARAAKPRARELSPSLSKASNSRSRTLSSSFASSWRDFSVRRRRPSARIADSLTIWSTGGLLAVLEHGGGEQRDVRRVVGHLREGDVGGRLGVGVLLVLRVHRPEEGGDQRLLDLLLGRAGRVRAGAARLADLAEGALLRDLERVDGLLQVEEVVVVVGPPEDPLVERGGRLLAARPESRWASVVGRPRPASSASGASGSGSSGRAASWWAAASWATGAGAASGRTAHAGPGGPRRRGRGTGHRGRTPGGPGGPHPQRPRRDRGEVASSSPLQRGPTGRGGAGRDAFPGCPEGRREYRTNGAETHRGCLPGGTQPGFGPYPLERLHLRRSMPGVKSRADPSTGGRRATRG